MKLGNKKMLRKADMQFIIENNCYNIEAIKSIMPYFKPLIDNVLISQKILSLDYFVIADSLEENYAETVNKYASIVGTDTYITQDGIYYTAGKSLDGIDENGNLHQAIVIKSSVWVCAAYEYLNSKGQLMEGALELMNTPKFMSLALILHEIGHAIDNENQYKISGTVDTKVLYDLEYEYDDYIKSTALSLWGEYFAESFAYNIIHLTDESTGEKESELEKCIGTYSIGTDRNTLLDRVYRILYLFVFQIAYVHQSGNFSTTFNYSKYEENELFSLYISLFARTEIAIINLYRTYPHWESYEQLDELSNILKDFILFEYKRQKTD